MRGAVATTIAILLAGAQASHAQKPSKVDEYEGYVSSASDAFAAGHYAKAELLFTRAYRLHADPRLLYNRAVAQDRQGKDEQALESFRRFLAVAPADHPLRGRAEQSALRLSKPLPAIPPTPAEGNSGPAPLVGESTAQTALESSSPIDSSSGFGAMSYTGIGVAALGVAGLAWGGLELSDAASVSEEFGSLPANTTWNRDEEARYAAGQSAETRGIIFMSLGGVAVVGGIALILLDGRGESSEPGPSVTIAPGRASVGYSGSF